MNSFGIGSGEPDNFNAGTAPSFGAGNVKASKTIMQPVKGGSVGPCDISSEGLVCPIMPYDCEGKNFIVPTGIGSGDGGAGGKLV